MANKATFKDLVAKKIAKNNKINKVYDIYISSMGKTLEFKHPSDDLLLDVMDNIGVVEGVQDTSRTVEAFKELIYNTCSMLQDPELHEELQVKNPISIVSEIFDLMDIMEIGNQLMEHIGINDKVEDIKK